MRFRAAGAFVFSLFVCGQVFAGLIVQDFVVEATGPGGAVVSYSAFAESSDGGEGRPTETVTCTPPSMSLFPIGMTTVSCTGSEGSTGSFTVTVRDTTGPSLSLPESFSVVTENTSEVVTFTASATDLVDGAVAVTCAPPSGSTFPFGATVVSCSAGDSRGNTATGSFTITLVETPPPPPPNPNDVTAEATGPDGAHVTYNLGNDNDDGRPITGCSPESGSLFPLGVTGVVCPSLSFEVTVVDTTPPALSLPETITVVSNVPATVTYSATATDLVDGVVSITCTPPSGSTFPLGTTSVSCSAADTRGNSASGSFSVLVVEEPPPPTNPDDITAEATGPGGAVVTYPARPDQGGRPVTCSPASGSTFPLGTTAVSCSDGSSFSVTVVDTTPPELTVPDSFELEATGPAGAVGLFMATALDLVDGFVAVSCTPPSGFTFALGGTTVTCTANDAAGNMTSAQFDVTVVDTTPPELTVPDSLELEATGPDGAVGVFATSAVDLVDGSVAVSCTPPSGSTFALGVTTVTCTANDAAGNMASAQFDVTVTDTTPPEFLSVIASPSSIWPPNNKLVEVTVTVDAFDVVDPTLFIQIYDVTCNEPISASDAVITGPLTVDLRADRDPHGSGRIYTIHVEAIDDSGNRAITSVEVRVPHDQGKRRAVR